jgi:hypothetical protein
MLSLEEGGEESQGALLGPISSVLIPNWLKEVQHSYKEDPEVQEIISTVNYGGPNWKGYKGRVYIGKGTD